jgi:GH25 family lysozyme M1 (1,4-beta-N-acetylmuramidase)
MVVSTSTYKPPPLNPYYPLCGYDVSRWQSGVDWDIAKSVGAGYIVIRSGNATTRDTRYPTHTANARNADVPFGAYHYFRPQYTAEEIAKTIRDTVSSWPQLGMFIDFEKNPVDNWPSNMTPAIITSKALALLEEADNIWGREVGIYTSPGWWNQWIVPNARTKFKLNRRHLWIANWYYNFTKYPQYPTGWPRSQVVFWQFSGNQGPYAGKARQLGVTGSVSIDVDCFMQGDVLKFRGMLGYLPWMPEE